MNRAAVFGTEHEAIETALQVHDSRLRIASLQWKSGNGVLDSGFTHAVAELAVLERWPTVFFSKRACFHGTNFLHAARMSVAGSSFHGMKGWPCVS
jgi:hypothetical protein